MFYVFLGHLEMNFILSAKEVSRAFMRDGSTRPVLMDVSFDVKPGEFVTVMGPSGSGKSTLLHCLSGLDQPDRGGVVLGGDEIFSLSEKERTLKRRDTVGFVFQFFNLLPDLTVEENLVLPLLIAGKEPGRYKERMDDLLKEMGLEGLKNRQPYSLSGGEMQRVSIARAMITSPSLIMADEPTGNLSTKAGKEIMALFRSVKERFKTAVLLVTHNPSDAAWGDRVLFLKDGILDPETTLEGPDLNASHVFSRLEELGI